VIAYSPLAQGLLSARYGPDHRPSGMRGALAPFLPENLELARPLFEVLRSVAKAHDAMPAQVALAWVIRHPNVVVIPGASSVAQMRLNAEAADLELSDDEAGELIDTAAAFRPVGGLAALPSIVRQRVGALSRRRAARS